MNIARTAAEREKKVIKNSNILNAKSSVSAGMASGRRL